MIDQSLPMNHHSAKVALFLEASGEVYPLSTVGPTYVVLRSPADIPSCFGEIRVFVDGSERVWPVVIGGAVPFDDDYTVPVFDREAS